MLTGSQTESGSTASSHKAPQSDLDWFAFVKRRKDDGFLRWVASFRCVSVLLQEPNMDDAFALLQSVLRSARPTQARIPNFHLLVCSFQIHFNQGQNDWEVYTTSGRDTAQLVLEAKYGQQAPASKRASLQVTGFAETEQQRSWFPNPDAGISCWLEPFHFCSSQFQADAMFNRADVVLAVNAVYYIRTGEEEEEV